MTAAIEPLKPEEDGLHIDMPRKGMYEWWYFDAHMETGHTVVVFFYAANPNPGPAGKAGVEIVVLRPDGKRARYSCLTASQPSRLLVTRLISSVARTT